MKFFQRLRMQQVIKNANRAHKQSKHLVSQLPDPESSGMVSLCIALVIAFALLVLVLNEMPHDDNNIVDCRSK